MLAVLGKGVPRSAGWAFELKWDGMRASIAVDERGGVHIRSRRGRDYTSCFPELHAVREALPSSTILDGEIVVLDEHGRPNFDGIQDRWHRPRASIAQRLARTNPVTFVAFDVLWCARRRLLDEPYVARRAALAALGFRGPRWFAPSDERIDGEALFNAAAAQGLEGIVAKRLSSPYRPGERSADWVKIKNYQTDRFVVGGWLPTDAGGVEALLVGRRVGAASLQFTGTVEFGLARSRRELRPALELLATERSPFEGWRASRARWVAPQLEATVRFIGWNRGVLREAILASLSVS